MPDQKNPVVIPEEARAALEDADSPDEAVQALAEQSQKQADDSIGIAERAVSNLENFVPKIVKLDEADAREMRKHNDQQIAVQQFVQAISQQGEQRIAQLQESGREMWMRIAKKYGIDLNRVDYAMNDDGDALVPMRMKLDA